MNGNNNSAGETFPNTGHSASSAGKHGNYPGTIHLEIKDRESGQQKALHYVLFEGISVPPKVALFT